MSDPVQLEEKSGKSKKSKQSKKSGNKSQNNDNQEVENNEMVQPTSTAPVLSTRAYLEQNVTPVVQEALLQCARERPPNPLEFVGNYILNRAKGK